MDRDILQQPLALHYTTGLLAINSYSFEDRAEIDLLDVGSQMGVEIT